MKTIIKIGKISLVMMGLISATLFPSCKKVSPNNSSTLSSTGYFLEVSVNGQTFTQKSAISVFGFENQNGCDTKLYNHQNISQIDVVSCFVEVNLTHKQNKVDFANSTSGTYAVKSEDMFSMTNPYPYGISCNLDLVVSFQDKTTANQETTLLPSSRINNITALSISKESSTATTYNITGNFTCTFKNSKNISIPVTGRYKTFIDVLK